MSTSEVSLYDASKFQPADSRLLIECGMSYGTKLWDSRIKALNILAGAVGVENSLVYVIVYFDLVTETFREVPLPDLLPDDAKFELGLDGCLCITRKSNRR